MQVTSKTKISSFQSNLMAAIKNKTRIGWWQYVQNSCQKSNKPFLTSQSKSLSDSNRSTPFLWCNRWNPRHSTIPRSLRLSSKLLSKWAIKILNWTFGFHIRKRGRSKVLSSWRTIGRKNNQQTNRKAASTRTQSPLQCLQLTTVTSSTTLPQLAKRTSV